MNGLKSEIKKNIDMNMTLVEIFGTMVPIVLFISIAWVINMIIDRRALHKERMLLIEKGGDSNLLIESKKEKHFFENGSLKYGLVLVGISLGVITGAIFDRIELFESAEIGYFFGVFLFSGIGLILSYYLNKKEDQ
ncbi:hypothetical protein UJ101_01738 [Flavobacteriaceae bacterium UJ101]|nr:hypothetical protein UJ101_01738 [Flavobacteriaceae bacterium UJ101]